MHRTDKDIGVVLTRIARIIAGAAFVAILLMGPSAAVAGSSGGVLPGSTVSASASSVYEFTVPASVRVTYPQTRVSLGAFRVDSLFLRDGERLRVLVTPRPLNKVGGGTALPYVVEFVDPGHLDALNVGESFDLGVVLDRAAFGLGSGTYRGSVVVSVVSHPDNVVVWQDSIVLSATRPSKTVSSWVLPRPSDTAGEPDGNDVPDGSGVDPDTGATPEGPGVDGSPGGAPSTGSGAQGEDQLDDGWLRWLIDSQWSKCCIPIVLLMLVPLLARRRKKDDPSEFPSTDMTK